MMHAVSKNAGTPVCTASERVIVAQIIAVMLLQGTRGTTAAAAAAAAAATVLAVVGVRRMLCTTARAATAAAVGAGEAPLPPRARAEERKKAAVYTRTGDGGTSMLYSMERRSKMDPVFEALGATDELNGVLGVAREHCKAAGNGLDPLLAEVQSRLFDVGAAVATPASSATDTRAARTHFGPQHTEELEAEIDRLDAALPPLRVFILPSGGFSASYLHLARSVARRAERCVVPLVSQGETEADVLTYLNRLSDFLFVAARYAAKTEGQTETEWRKAKEAADTLAGGEGAEPVQ